MASFSPDSSEEVNSISIEYMEDKAQPVFAYTEEKVDAMTILSQDPSHVRGSFPLIKLLVLT